jgi:dsDNA-specific endonuclease/ATPase MutS2
MMFEVGQEVSILHETGVFKVLEIEAGQLTLQDEFGFSQKIAPHLVVPRKAVSIGKLIVKDATSPVSTSTKKSPQKSEPFIDLHAEALGLSAQLQAHDLLLAQMSAFKKFCNLQHQQRVQKFKVIHGAGEGRLKQELRLLVQGKEGLQMHDAQWHHGAVGASIIEMIQSKFERF